jgi:Protein of unknown function (DUF3631)/Domain of unknown function (DUF3854)
MLADDHREVLTRSGIDPDLVPSRGYETITSTGRLAEIKIATAGRLIPGLLVPLRDVRGSVWGHQYRPDSPRMVGDRLVKYETPTGQRNGLDVPLGVGPKLADPTIPLWITEGSKKADCAVAHELCCVALIGVWNWRGTNNLGGKVALSDFNDIALDGRRAIIAYDGDVAGKKSVHAAMDALARYLAYRGARPEFLHLPDEDSKVGLDDFLMSHPVEELWQRVEPIAPRVRQGTHEQAPTKEPPPFGSIDGAALLGDLKCWFERFICLLDDADYDILTLWTVHTHLAKELRTTPRLLLDSPIHESGKTTLLEHLLRLCFNPIEAAVISSEALLPRMLEQGLHTVLLDEVHRTLRSDKPGVQDLLAVMNSGYRLGATRPVLAPAAGGEWQVRKMSTFAPMAMAGNAPSLPDDTMSRTLRILMMPDRANLSEDTDWEFIEDEAQALAARIAEWADSVRTVIAQTVVDLPDGCVRRAKERWRPLKRVAELAGGGWPKTCDELIVRNLAEDAAEREAGLRERPPGIALLTDLYAVWRCDEPFIATKDLLSRLIAHDQSYWGSDSPYGRELTEQRLGRMLVQAAKVTSARPGGGGHPRGYLRSQLDTAWQRLGISQAFKPPSPQTGRSGRIGRTGPNGQPTTGSTGSTDSTGSNGRGVESFESFEDCCLDCGTPLKPDEIAVDYCAECADARADPAGTDPLRADG